LIYRAATTFESRTGWQRALGVERSRSGIPQRDDWGQLYQRRPSTSGKLKNKITSGEGPVTQIVRIDLATRIALVRRPDARRDKDPYFAHYHRYRALDGKSPQMSLTPDVGDLIPS
jgi:hypothetical protein